MADNEYEAVREEIRQALQTGSENPVAYREQYSYCYNIVSG